MHPNHFSRFFILGLALSLTFGTGLQSVVAGPEQSTEPSTPAASGEAAPSRSGTSSGSQLEEPESVAVEPYDAGSASDNAGGAAEDVSAQTAAANPPPYTPAPRSAEAVKNSAIEHWERSKKYYSAGDWKMCQLELELAIMEWPTMQIAHRDLCVLSLLQLDGLRTLAEFMMTVGLGDPIPLDAEQSGKLIKRATVQHYNKAMEFARKQDWQNTIYELKCARELSPADFLVQRSLAFAHASAGDFQSAEACYEQTFELEPDDSSTRADFAYLLADQGKLGEAQNQLEQAVRSSPRTAAYHVDLCWMAEARGDFGTAQRELQQAVELSPAHAGLWAHLGRIYEKQGKRQEATRAYLKALGLDPKHQEAKESLAKLHSAEG